MPIVFVPAVVVVPIVPRPLVPKVATVPATPVPAIADGNVGHRPRDRAGPNVRKVSVVPARAVPPTIVVVVPVAAVAIDVVVVVAHVVDPGSGHHPHVGLALEQELRSPIRITQTQV